MLVNLIIKLRWPHRSMVKTASNQNSESQNGNMHKRRQLPWSIWLSFVLCRLFDHTSLSPIWLYSPYPEYSNKLEIWAVQPTCRPMQAALFITARYLDLWLFIYLFIYSYPVNWLRIPILWEFHRTRGNFQHLLAYNSDNDCQFTRTNMIQLFTERFTISSHWVTLSSAKTKV